MQRGHRYLLFLQICRQTVYFQAASDPAQNFRFTNGEDFQTPPRGNQIPTGNPAYQAPPPQILVNQMPRGRFGNIGNIPVGAFMQAPVDQCFITTRMPPVGEGFEIKSSLISLMASKPFSGSITEDPQAHLELFMKNATTVKFRGTSDDAAWIRLFRFLLIEQLMFGLEAFKNLQHGRTWRRCS